MGTNTVGDVTSAGAETRRRLALRRLGFANPPDLVGFDTIVRTAGLALDVSSACICLGESADWWILCSYGTDAAFEPFETKLRGPAGSRTELFVVEDCRMDARFAQQSVGRASPAIGFYASCALIGPDRDVLGALCVMDEHARRFDARSREVLRGLAVWAQGELNAVDRERSRLEALNARLVAPAVHRARGALTSIHGFSSFLLDQDCAPEQRQEVLGIIHDQASYLASVVTELVDLVNIEIVAGRDWKFVRQPAAELLREVISAHDGGKVNLHIEEGLPPISVDADHLRRGLLRLLRYASDGSMKGEDVNVSLTRADEPGYLAVSVKHRCREPLHPDVGRVFEPFSPPNRDELHGAANLGLALTKEIIDLHGGKALVSGDQRRHCVEVSLLLPIPA